MTRTIPQRFPWAGLLSGPLAWALSFQGNWLLIDWQCAHALMPVPFTSALLAIVALGGGAISWRAWRAAPSADDIHGHRFLPAVAALAALLFTLAIVLQAAAGVIFTGCER